MEFVEDEYNNYWETKRFYDELDNWTFDEEILSSCHESSSTDYNAPSSSSPTKNIAEMQRKRRKIDDSLYALRSVVPNISKMDKASIIKDTIDYVQELQKQERSLNEEIVALESAPTSDDSRKRNRETYSSSPKLSIELMELSVSDIGENTFVVRYNCSMKSMKNACEIFESLDLQIVSANIVSESGSLLHTLYVEVNDIDCLQLKQKIDVAFLEYELVECT